MAYSQEAADAVIRQLYEAALEPVRWRGAMDGLRRMFDGAASVMFVHDLKTGEMPFWLGVETSVEGQQEYVEHIKDVNPRALHSLARPVGEIAWDYLVMPEETMRRDPFYDWLRRTEGLQYFVGCRMLEEGSRSAFISIEWPQRHGHADAATIELFARLVPHVKQALHLSLSRSQAQARSAAFEALVEAFDCGVVVLDRCGRIVSANAAAQAMFAADDGLTANAELRAGRSADQRALERAIAAAIATAQGDRLAPPAGFLLARRSGAAPYFVSVFPLPVEPFPGLTARPAAAVVIRDMALVFRPSASMLQTVYGLTRREVDLAMALAGGTTLSQAAARLAMAYNTARVHLRGIFAKTGVRTQVELIRLLSNLPPQRQPPTGASNASDSHNPFGLSATD